MRTLFLFVTLIFSATVFAGDLGLLLGLSGSQGTGSTVWVERQGDTVTAKHVGDGYWINRQDGLWHVLDENSTSTKNRAIVKVRNAQGELVLEVADPNSSGTDTLVSYIAPRALGLITRPSLKPKRSYGGTGFDFTGGTGVHYLNLNWRSRLREITNGFVKGEIGAIVIDKSVTAEFKKLDRTFYVRYPTDNWTLTRNRGAWLLSGIEYPLRGSGDDPHEFAIGEITEAKFGARAGGRPSWQQVHSLHRDALDYETSPDGSLTLVVTSKKLFVYSSSESSFGKLLQQIDVPAERIVMTQWLEGDEVRKVGEAVTKIKR